MDVVLARSQLQEVILLPVAGVQSAAVPGVASPVEGSQWLIMCTGPLLGTFRSGPRSTRFASPGVPIVVTVPMPFVDLILTGQAAGLTAIVQPYRPEGRDR